MGNRKSCAASRIIKALKPGESVIIEKKSEVLAMNAMYAGIRVRTEVVKIFDRNDKVTTATRVTAYGRYFPTKRWVLFNDNKPFPGEKIVIEVQGVETVDTYEAWMANVYEKWKPYSY